MNSIKPLLPLLALLLAVVPISAQTAQEMFARGVAAREGEKHKEAIAHFTKAIELDPKFSEAYRKRGAVYSDLHYFGLAMLDYNRALRLNPKDAQVYYNRGLLFGDAKIWERAWVEFGKAIELMPNDPEAYYQRALLLRNLSLDEVSHHETGKLTRSQTPSTILMTDIQMAIKLKPDFALGYYLRGSVYSGHWVISSSKEEDIRRAIEDYTTAIKLNPTTKGVYQARAGLYREAGRLAEALADLNTGLVNEPEDDHAYLERAQVHLGMGNRELAIKDLRKAVQINPAREGFTITDPTGKLEAISAEAPEKPEKRITITVDEYYSRRGWILVDEGKYQDGIREFEKGITTEPRATSLHADAAWAYLYASKPADAYRHATAYLEWNWTFGDDKIEPLIVAYFSLRKQNKPAEAKLFLETWGDPVATLDDDSWLFENRDYGWHTHIVRYLRGEMTEADLLKKAKSANMWLQEAQAYIGEMALLAGNPEKAKFHFNWVVKNGEDTAQQTLSRIELAALNTPKSSK